MLRFFGRVNPGRHRPGFAFCLQVCYNGACARVGCEVPQLGGWGYRHVQAEISSGAFSSGVVSDCGKSMFCSYCGWKTLS